MRMRTRRMLVALLGVVAVAALAPQLASADPTTGSISGTVTNSAQQDLAGIYVSVTNVGTGNSYSATTGSDGTYTVSGLPAGGYQVLFLPNNGQSQNYVYQYFPDKSNAAAAQAVSVSAGQTALHVDAALATGATVSGKVIDAGTGGPVSGVYVYVYDYGNFGPNHVSSNSTRTDANGEWSLAGYPTGTYQVQFSPPYGSGFANQYWNDVSGQDPPTPITLTAGSTTSNVNAALVAGGQISGTVTNGMTGLPAQGVSVAALDNSGAQFATAVTDAGGHYILNGLSSSTSYRVEFYPPYGSGLATEFYKNGANLAEATPVTVTVGQATPNIDETLSEGASISGVVTDAATGYPLGGVNIKLLDLAGVQVFTYNGGTTESDGSYSLTNIPPGSYKVEFSSEGALGFQYYNNVSTLSDATGLTLSAGQAVTHIDAGLTQGGRLEGLVTDTATGQALANAYVSIYDAKGTYVAFGFTDPSGHYEISGIAPGTYYVMVYPAYQGPAGTDQPEFYGGTPGLTGAAPVTIRAGATTAGIDIAVSPGSATPPNVSGQATGTPTTTATPQTPVAVVAQVIPGPPTLFGGSVAGLGKGKPVVKFRLRSGSNGAHKLRSFKVKLPAGLAFVGAQLRRGVKVTGGGKVTEKLIAGQLVVTLGSPASTVTVSISWPALRVTRTSTAHPLRVLVTVTPVGGTGHLLAFTVKSPS